jgi:hypothetical protein
MKRPGREKRLVASLRQELRDGRAYNPTVMEDLLFLHEWQEGRAPSLSAFFRARQIRRTAPVRAVETR